MEDLASSREALLERVVALEAQLADAQVELDRQRRLIALYEQIPAGIFSMPVKRSDGGRLISSYIERLAGVTPAEWCADPELWERLVHPDDRAQVLAHAAEALATNRRLISEYRVRRRDGSWVWIHEEADLIADEASAARRFEGYFFAITDRKEAEASARSQETLYRSLVENTPDVIARVDRQGRVISITRNSELTFGIAVKDHVGRTGVELGMATGPFAAFRASVERTMLTGVPQTIDHTFETPDGERSFEARIVPESGPDGAVDTVMLIVRDMTEQRRAEAALRESEERLRLALDAAAMVAWEAEVVSGRTIWIGDPDAVLGTQGLTEAGLSEFIRPIAPEDLALAQEPFLTAGVGDELRVEHRYYRHDGTIGWVESYARLVARGDQRSDVFVGMSRDITPRKQMEAELRRRERQFTALVENSPGAIFRQQLVPERTYAYVSPAVLRLFGHPPEAFLADPDFLLQIVHPGDQQIVERLNVAAQAPTATVLRVRHREGQLVWVELNSSPIFADDGSVVAVEGVFHDVTAHKQLEQTLLRQTRLQGMLAAALRLLHSPGHDKHTRALILNAVASELCLGVEAAHVLIWARDEAAGLRLVAAAGPQAMPPTDGVVLALAALPAPAHECLAADRPPQAPCSVPAFAPIVGAVELYYLLPIRWTAVSWGFVAIGVPTAIVLDDEVLTIAATVVELTTTTLRRWLAVDALLEREEQLRLALEAAQLGTFDVDLASGSVTASGEFVRLLGFEGDKNVFALEDLFSRLHPADRGVARDALINIPMASGRAVREMRIVRPDGGLLWVRTLGQYVSRDGDAPGRVIGVLMDVTLQREAQEAIERLNSSLELRVHERTAELEITNRALRYEIEDRERAEAALRENQRFVERVMAAFPAQLYVFDYRLKRLTYTNKSLPALLGYTPEIQTLLGDYPIEKLMHPDDLARLPSVYERYNLLGDDDLVDNEFRVRMPDGEWRWYATRDIVFVRGEDGKPAQMLGAGIDITARKQAETELAAAFKQLDTLNAELRRSDSLLRTIVNSLGDGLVLIDQDGRVLMVNRAILTLCGLESSEPVGYHWREVCPFDSPLIEQALSQALAFNGRERVTWSGVTRVFDVQAIPLVTPGAGGQIVLHLVDVTERLQFEALALKNERLAATGRLAGIVAHEVNSPLQAIQNILYLADCDDAAERSSYLAMIADEIERIGGLIRRLLDLQRPGDDVLRVLDLNALIDKVLAVTSTTTDRQRVQVKRDLAAGPARIEGRSDQLTQVLLNLILNALDTMPHGGELLIRSRLWSGETDDRRSDIASTPMIIVEVADTGHGIPEAMLPRIFEPFFTTKPSGSGLGLAISRQIVEQHGGHVSARNRPSKGALFTIVIPALTATTATTDQPNAQA